MPKRHRLADLQLAIMHVLWERGAATAREVREALREARPLAYTTVATMLARMERSGQVAHEIEGRVNVYRAVVGRDDVSRSMVRDLASRLFQGDVTEMVSHLLDGCEVGPEELGRLRRLIRRREKEARHDA